MMATLTRSRTAGILSLGLLAWGLVACGSSSSPSVKSGETTAASTPVSTANSPAPAEKPSPAVPATKIDPLEAAIDKAASAESIFRSATSNDDVRLAVERWNQAINLAKLVPASSPRKKEVDKKVAEFTYSLNMAKGRLKGRNVDASDLAPGFNGGKLVHRAPIKYRLANIPVIDVVFNDSQRFEMLVDTGASVTMITPAMAEALNLKVEGVVPLGTAGGGVLAPLGYVSSISVGQTTIRNVPVTVGPLSKGLLGHDFFDHCKGLRINADVVEFEQCNS